MENKQETQIPRLYLGATDFQPIRLLMERTPLLNSTLECLALTFHERLSLETDNERQFKLIDRLCEKSEVTIPLLLDCLQKCDELDLTIAIRAEYRRIIGSRKYTQDFRKRTLDQLDLEDQKDRTRVEHKEIHNKKKKQESIIVENVRPSFLTQYGQFCVQVDAPSENNWETYVYMLNELLKNQKKLEKLIPSVGCVCVQKNNRTIPIGSGFLVEFKKKCLFVTNSHVANHFLYRNNDGLRLHDWLNPHIDFIREFERDDHMVMPLAFPILYSKDPDLCVFSVDLDPRILSELKPLSLTSGDSRFDDSFVVVVGYPSQFGGVDDAIKSDRWETFQSLGYKHVSPGVVVTTSYNGCIYHDCSTVRGNSGSPIIDLSTLEVIGIHFEGDRLFNGKKYNVGMSSRVILETLEKLLV
jgi:hypothetical protein